MQFEEYVDNLADSGCLKIPFGVQASLLGPQHILINDWLEFEWALETNIFLLCKCSLHG